MVSTGAAVLIITVVCLAGSARAQTQDLNVTRYVAIGTQNVVKLPEQVPVKLDCRPLAVLAFGNELNLSSIEWRRNTITVEDNTTVRNVFISPNNLCLLLSALTIRTGAEDGTEAIFTCRACRNDPPGRKCADFSTELIASSPPVLECTDPPAPASGFVNLDIGCDLCVERGQTVDFLTLDCTPDTRRQPTNCTIRNPDGIPAAMLDDGMNVVAQGNQITISMEIMNPENPAPPTFLGVWTCTCVNADGISTAESKIDSCLVPPRIDKGFPRRPITVFPPYLSQGSRTFKIGGNDFVITGNQFTILCNILEGNPPPTITWTRDGVTLPQNSTSINIFVNKTDPDEAAGRYMCEASNAAGSDDAISVMRLGQEIFEPPVIARGPRVDPPTDVPIGDVVADIGSNVYVIRGSGVTINCDLMNPGLPRANITWTKNGRPFSEAIIDMGDRLRIVSTNKTSEAYYCCKAENLAGADEACSSVFLRGGGPNIRKGFEFDPPVNPELVTLSRKLTTDIGGSAYATVGAEIEVLCPVTFAEPDVTTFTWTFTNAAGITSPINPTFTPTPMTGEESGTVTVDGDVRITVYRHIMRQTSRIVIESNRTGYEVTCIAMSPLGSDNATTNFQAYAPPVISPEGMPSFLPPEVPITPMPDEIGSTFHMVAGRDLTVNCPSVGAIPPGSEEYNWYYKGKRIIDQSNFTDNNMNRIGKFIITTIGGMSTLIIRNVSRSDNGEIQCLVFNPAGSDVSSSRVRVYSDVLIAKGDRNVTIGPEERTGTIGNKFLVPRGKRAFINCGFADSGGFPFNESVGLPAVIEWSFNGVPVSPDLFSLLHGNQLCIDPTLFNLTGNDNFECKSTSRITDGVMRQMDSETSNVMLVEGPVIDRDALPDVIVNRKRVSFGSGITRVIIAGTTVDLRCRINETMPPSTLVWFVDTGDGDTVISSALNPKYTLLDATTTVDLSISNFAAGEVGCYSCRAENSVSMDNARVCLRLCPLDSSSAPCPSNPFNNDTFVVRLPQEDPDDICPFCAFFFTSEFGPCLPACHAGRQERIVECLAGSRIIDLQVCADRSDPPTAIPANNQSCTNMFQGDDRSCLLDPRWMIGPWSTCTRTCEGGVQLRQVMCRIPASGKLVPDYKCSPFVRKPITWRRCNKYIPCGCEDYSESCKYIAGNRCLRKADYLTCCKTCRQGQSPHAPGHG